METRRLYYEDCHIREFTATVTACRETEKGYLVELDATAFYPEGGGQACDLGTLEDARVLDVREQESAIVHLCDKPLAAGQQVTGKIDWQRRFDLMQQHTGEHIVSGILHQMFGCHNTGFHVGAEVMQVDFDCLVPAEKIPQIQMLANEAIYQNLPVKCWYPSREELPNIPYRTKRELPWPVRIVEVPGYDSCACCGVHVAHTGQIGLILILSCVKFHQGVRMEILCGKRALSYMSRIYDQNRQVCQAFSAKMLEIGAAAQRMNEALAAEKFRSAGLERQLFDAIAAGYAGCGHAVHFTQGLMPASVRDLAERIAQVCAGTAAVFSGEDGLGYNMCLVGDPDSAQSLGKALCQQLDGKGGGKAGFFQGSVKGTKEQIEKILQAEKN